MSIYTYTVGSIHVNNTINPVNEPCSLYPKFNHLLQRSAIIFISDLRKKCEIL